MKFLFFVEGHTEQKVLGPFVQSWLNQRLNRNVGVSTINLKGNTHFRGKIQGLVRYHMSQDHHGEIVAAIGLLDLYQAVDFPSDQRTVAQRHKWAVEDFEKRVDHEKFKMFFAVHETEAWLFSDPQVFPRPVQSKIQGRLSRRPEEVNFSNPPAKQLGTIYRSEMGRRYKKITNGVNLFGRLDTEIAYEKCPYLKIMLDELLRLAEAAS